MVQIYIDTNIFLGFYQSGKDRLKVFQEIIARADQVILTEQTINEFRRNRATCLSNLVKNVTEAGRISVTNVSVVSDLPQFAKWDEAHKATRKHAKEISDQLGEWIDNEASDPVYNEFVKLVGKAVILPTTTAGFEKAQRRKSLGNPPMSQDKGTICDELIWETLLEGCKADLIIVSRDKTFNKNQGLLKQEFAATVNQRLVLVTEHLGKALETVGKPSKEIVDAEKVIDASNRGVDISAYSLSLEERDGFAVDENNPAFTWHVLELSRVNDADFFTRPYAQASGLSEDEARVGLTERLLALGWSGAEIRGLFIKFWIG